MATAQAKDRGRARRPPRAASSQLTAPSVAQLTCSLWAADVAAAAAGDLTTTSLPPSLAWAMPAPRNYPQQEVFITPIDPGSTPDTLRPARNSEPLAVPLRGGPVTADTLRWLVSEILGEQPGSVVLRLVPRTINRIPGTTALGVYLRCCRSDWPVDLPLATVGLSGEMDAAAFAAFDRGVHVL